MPTIKITDAHLGLLMRMAAASGVSPAEAFGAMVEDAAQAGGTTPAPGAPAAPASKPVGGKKSEGSARAAALARLDGEAADEEDDGH